MGENFSNLGKKMKIQIQSAPNKRNPKKFTMRHNSIKVQI